ncbi:MAG: hypothetical protein KDK08_29540 [Rhizobiaceae bacterium]|nr:hypothetical protein [Rhizobiaceae bacterium]
MKVSHVRIYPHRDGGFEVWARVRGGLQNTGRYSTVTEALDATRALDLKKPDDPVYVYPLPLGVSLARHLNAEIGKATKQAERFKRLEDRA